jgi:hypothetical protein
LKFSIAGLLAGQDSPVCAQQAANLYTAVFIMIAGSFLVLYATPIQSRAVEATQDVASRRQFENNATPAFAPHGVLKCHSERGRRLYNYLDRAKEEDSDQTTLGQAD